MTVDVYLEMTLKVSREEFKTITKSLSGLSTAGSREAKELALKLLNQAKRQTEHHASLFDGACQHLVMELAGWTEKEATNG
jgi:recombinational DNA repair protein RecR